MDRRCEFGDWPAEARTTRVDGRQEVARTRKHGGIECATGGRNGEVNCLVSALLCEEIDEGHGSLVNMGGLIRALIVRCAMMGGVGDAP